MSGWSDERAGYLEGVELTELEVEVVEWNKGVRVREIVVAGKSWGWVDAGIAEALERINAAGYRSAQSCSGLKGDHEHKKTVGGGYIAWFADDLSETQIKAIERAAIVAGLSFQHSDLFFLPAVSVRSSQLKDGSSEEVVRREATKKTNAAWGIAQRPEGAEFMTWLKQRDLLMRGEIERRGGYALNTDEALSATWNAFSEELLAAS